MHPYKLTNSNDGVKSIVRHKLQMLRGLCSRVAAEQLHGQHNSTAETGNATTCSKGHIKLLCVSALLRPTHLYTAYNCALRQAGLCS